jgi:hypothetical protein
MSKQKDEKPLYLVTVNQGQQIFTAESGEEKSILDLLGDKNVVIFAPYPKTFKEFFYEYNEQQRQQEKLANCNHIGGSGCPN